MFISKAVILLPFSPHQKRAKKKPFHVLSRRVKLSEINWTHISSRLYRFPSNEVTNEAKPAGWRMLVLCMHAQGE